METPPNTSEAAEKDYRAINALRVHSEQHLHGQRQFTTTQLQSILGRGYPLSQLVKDGTLVATDQGFALADESMLSKEFENV